MGRKLERVASQLADSGDFHHDSVLKRLIAVMLFGEDNSLTAGQGISAAVFDSS